MTHQHHHLDHETGAQCTTLTFLLLPQVLHDGEGECGAGHQCGQDAQHDAHHVVVAHPHHCAHVVDLPVDGDLEPRV